MVKYKQDNLPQKNTPPTIASHIKDFTSLSDTDLLEYLLFQNTSSHQNTTATQQIMAHFGGLRGLLNASLSELSQIPYITDSQKRRLIANLEISRRLLNFTTEDYVTVTNAEDAYRLISDMTHLSREHIRLILLDNQQQVIATPTVYVGTINTAVLRSAEIYKEAILRDAPALILVHNHPSGNASPSPEDITLTKDLHNAGQLLDIVFVDHIIIGKNGWTSLKEMGLGFDTV